MKLNSLERLQDKMIFGTDALHPHLPLLMANFLRLAPISEAALEKKACGIPSRLLTLEDC